MNVDYVSGKKQKRKIKTKEQKGEKQILNNCKIFLYDFGFCIKKNNV